MDLRHVRYFSAVAAAGGVGRAAAALRLAQPALSRQIRDLEEEMGVRLLERGPRGVRVTAAGEIFHEIGTRVLEELESALGAVRAAVAGETGQCRLGIGPLPLSVSPIAGMLSRLPDLVPGIAIDVQLADAIRQTERLRSGALDVAIFGLSGELVPDMASEVLLSSVFDSAMVARSSPLAGREVLDAADLSREPVIFLAPSRAPQLVEAARAALDAAGISSPRHFHFMSPQSVMMMVASGRGWAPVPGLAAQRPPEGTAIVPVRGLRFPLQIAMVWRRDTERATTLAVLDALRALRDGTAPAGPALPATAPDRIGAPGLPGVPPGLETRHLRYFAAVADEGSFGRAAERLGLTQPALSRQIADLEHHVGAPLLARTPRGVTASDAGRVLREGAERVLATLEELNGAMERARRGLTGRCVIGAVLSSTTAPTLAALQALSRERWPALELIFEDYSTTDQPGALRESDIDVGLCYTFHDLGHDPDLVHERLVDDAIEGALVAAGHPLAARGTITPAELAELPFLFMAREHQPAFYDRTLDALRELGLEPRLEDQYDSLHVIGALIAAGRGWTLGPRTFARTPPPGMVMVRVSGLHMPWGLDLLHRQRETSAAVLKVVGMLRELRDRAPGAAAPAPNARRRARPSARRAPHRARRPPRSG